MMITILLYSEAILIETILFVIYLRLRLVEVKLPEPCSSLVKHLNIFHGNINNKVSKGAKIRNRYNQVPHLTQDTNGKVTNSQ